MLPPLSSNHISGPMGSPSGQIMCPHMPNCTGMQGCSTARSSTKVKLVHGIVSWIDPVHMAGPVHQITLWMPNHTGSGLWTSLVPFIHPTWPEGWVPLSYSMLHLYTGITASTVSANHSLKLGVSNKWPTPLNLAHWATSRHWELGNMACCQIQSPVALLAISGEVGSQPPHLNSLLQTCHLWSPCNHCHVHYNSPHILSWIWPTRNPAIWIWIWPGAPSEFDTPALYQHCYTNQSSTKPVFLACWLKAVIFLESPNSVVLPTFWNIIFKVSCCQEIHLKTCCFHFCKVRIWPYGECQAKKKKCYHTRKQHEIGFYFFNSHHVRWKFCKCTVISLEQCWRTEEKNCFF